MQGETAALERLEHELKEIRASWPESGVPARPTLIVAAVDLHGYYTALEVLLERVARGVDEEVATGPSWQSELLAQMALEIPSLRPAAIPAAVVPDLHELRTFRHFFRNAHTLDPDPARVLEHIERVLRVHPPIAHNARRVNPRGPSLTLIRGGAARSRRAWTRDESAGNIPPRSGLAVAALAIGLFGCGDGPKNATFDRLEPTLFDLDHGAGSLYSRPYLARAIDYVVLVPMAAGLPVGGFVWRAAPPPNVLPSRSSRRFHGGLPPGYPRLRLD